MNKFVLSALALTTAGGMSFAGTGSEEWLTLDREIESLASTLAPQDSSGVSIGGFLRTTYLNSGDVTFPGGNDLGGFTLDNARVNVSGDVGDFSVYMSFDGGENPFAASQLLLIPGGAGAGTVGTLDAFAAWNINEQFKLTMGQFRSPFLASAQINENNLLFLTRSLNSTLAVGRDQGVKLSGDYDQFGWAVAVQNGIDAAGDDLALTVAAAFHAMGSGGAAQSEGGYGTGQDNSLDISAGYYDDSGTVDNATAFNLEAAFRTGPLYLAGEYVDYDTGVVLVGDTGPYSLVVSWMFVPERWEAALRYEDLDDANSSSFLTLGLNYYIVGHDAKWQLNWGSLSSDAGDADILGIGLTAGV